MIGMGERTSPQSVGDARPQPVQGRRGAARPRGQAAAVALLHAPRHGDDDGRPRRRHALSRRRRRRRPDLDPPTRRRRPATCPSSSRSPATSSMRSEHALGLDAIRIIPTGGDTAEIGPRAVGRRQQRRLPRARRGGRLRAQRRHQHPPAQGGHRGHHDRRFRARPRPRRLALHDLSDRRDAAY